MRHYRNLALSIAGALLVVAVVYNSSAPSANSVLSEIDREDGSTALINAVLVARADKISTSEASDILGIDPKLPFMGVSAFESKRHRSSKSTPRALEQTQKTEQLWMPKQLMLGHRIVVNPAAFQGLDEIDPSTQFCSDAADCLRNEDYFKQVRNP